VGPPFQLQEQPSEHPRPLGKNYWGISLSPGALTVVAFLQECFMGRIVGMIMCFWGTFFLSYFVVTVTNMLSFSIS
jgi:hypothetical protein